MTTALLCALGGYLVGSIPVGLLIGLARGVDIRRHGSGNIGATNAGRVLGKRFGLLCFALDMLKGLVPALVCGWLLGTLGRLDLPPQRTFTWLAVAACPMLGHIFPIWLRFKGGKGISTGLGVMLGVFPVLTIAAAGAAGVWAFALRLTRMVGISSVAAALSMPLTVGIIALAAPAADGRGPLWPYAAVTGVLALLTVWTHRGNIQRTIAGTEPRIGARSHRDQPRGTPADSR